MRSWQAFRFLISIVALSGFLAASLRGEGTSVEEAAEFFFSNFEYSGFDLSPDGSHISMIIHKEDYDSLGTFNFASGKLNTASGKPGQSVYSYNWIGGDALLVSLGQWGIYHYGMYVSDEDLSDFRALGTSQAPTSARKTTDHALLRVQDPLPAVPGVALLVDRTSSREFPATVYYSADGNRFFDFQKNGGHDVGWICDQEGSIRFIERLSTPGNTQWYYRPSVDAEWEPFMDSGRMDIRYFDAVNQSVVAVDSETLFVVDVKTGKPIGRSVSNPVYSCRPNLLLDLETDALVGFVYFWDKPKVAYFNPDYRNIHSSIQNLFPGGTCTVLGVSQRSSVFFTVSSDVQPQSVYELKLGEEAGLNRILNQAPWIDSERCRPMEPISFTARDGEMVYGYLTRVQDGSGQAGPTVMLVHGGPFSRDSWGFDREAQFLARLGYNVIQVNYRGSSGFNSVYSMIGVDDRLFKTCEKAISDVADGARWAIEEGIADPDRIAIMGGSFGGYAALAGAAFEPDLYKVAIGFAGVYDYDRQLRSTYRLKSGIREWSKETVGDINADRTHYESVSPVHFADRIQAEVLLIHGSADSTVNADQSKRMSKALKKAKKKHVLKIENWGVHGHLYQKERIKYGVMIGEFLEENL